ncbi:MAG: hypothetical protein ABSC90_13020 [Acidimicrobiales bacterium]|jgi:hypothetical protein
MTNVLYFAAIIAFFALMLGFVFCHGRKADSQEFEASGLSAEGDDHDALRSVTS